ncbi:Structure-specific endonuclease subunit slx1 [Elsinoe australis]|uniref:Structure-specific endonuclease subunit slx1 n=1 Tax=Elsinoe australis TaxID=40998 RepID=A0A2P7YL63_9PEZI|nr:Structure-specific endonuclease subunit slx1 [Elsinoe australis]
MGTKTKYSPRTGRKHTKVTRPRMSLSDRLINLHILLSAQSFRRWPLSVRFFAQDVYKAWQKVVLQRQALPLLPSDVACDAARNYKSSNKQQDEHIENDENIEPKTGIHALDYTYQPMKEHLEHSLSRLADEKLHCHSCKTDLSPSADLVLICPHRECNSAYHLTCLSGKFVSTDDESVLPKAQACPSCAKHVRWSDLVKDLSLRSRGSKEQAALFKQKGRKKGPKPAKEAASDLLEALSEISELTELDDEDAVMPDSPVVSGRADAEDTVAGAPQDEWQDLVDESDDQYVSSKSTNSPRKRASKGKGLKKHAKTGNESDWSNAEEID